MGLDVTRKIFGFLPGGEEVSAFVLNSGNGLEVTLCNYGATVVSAMLPDKRGRKVDVVVGPKTLAGFLQSDSFFGSTVGRVANRIGGACFKIGTTEYALEKNNGANHLHGGSQGFHRRLWQADIFRQGSVAGVQFSLDSADGEGGYPGNAKVVVSYRISDSNELRIELSAESDQPTPIDMTNHTYWNLRGAGSGETVENLFVRILAPQTLEVDSGLIPTGAILDVDGTPYDLRSEKRLGDMFAKLTRGYDNFYVLEEKGMSIELAAEVHDPASGRMLSVYTSAPGLQFYSGSFMDGTEKCAGFPKNSALCLEPHTHIDAVNQPAFPDIILQPGRTYSNIIGYRLGF